jgi:hypothetical protein
VIVPTATATTEIPEITAILAIRGTPETLTTEDLAEEMEDLSTPLVKL